MKKIVIIIFIGLAIGAGIGVIGQFDVATAPGHEGQLVVSGDMNDYLQIKIPGIGTTYFNPAVFIVLLLLAFVALYFLIRTIIALVTGPKRTKQAWRSRRRRKSREGLQRGLLQLAEGEWAKAERTLQRSAKNSDIPMLHHLGAARAAQLQQATDRRDIYLAKADDCLPKSTHAVLITQAELQIAQGQYEDALITLEHVRQNKPKHPYVLRMLAQVYRELGDWERLAEIQPKLKRHAALTKTELIQLDRDIAAERLQLANLPLETIAKQTEKDTVKQRWRDLSKKQRQDLELRQIYVRELIAAGDQRFAAAAIVDGLKQHWDSELLLAYSQIEMDDSASQLKQVEKWLKQHPKDPVLLLTAGRLCRRNELFGRARTYLESSLAVHPRRDTYEELASLYIQLEEPELAQDAYQQALALQQNLALTSVHSNELNSGTASANHQSSSTETKQNLPQLIGNAGSTGAV